jgi:hypothetical protein
MTIEELEKILGDKQYRMCDFIKFIYIGDKPERLRGIGGFLIFPGVPGDIIKFIEPGKYEVMVKARSLKLYVKKVKGDL